MWDNPPELGIAGWPITLQGTVMGVTVNWTKNTGSTGDYSFTDLVAATYRITEGSPPADYTGYVPSPSTPTFRDVTLTPDVMTAANINFYNYLPMNPQVETRLTKTEAMPTSPVSSLTIDIGETVWDYAIVTGDPLHNGNVQFTVKEPGALAFVDHGSPVALTQVGSDWVAKSAPYTATKWGQHVFKAVYAKGAEQTWS
ncbi:MAG: hypothetical protein Q8P50_02835, partial [Bacillota bacterium]|nr:hypothetical protein [Bacillota bacterium]